MENKYYTPTIEELHIGYECEVKPVNKEYDWEKTTLRYQNEMGKPSDGLYHLYPFWWAYRHKDSTYLPIKIQINTLDQIRTKYLDGDDIVSLGWKRVWGDGQDGIYTQSFEKDKNILSFSTGWNDKVDKLSIRYTWNGKATNTRFEGVIKSINELRTIMRFLNIKQ